VLFKAISKTGAIALCDGVAVWLGKREAVTVGDASERSGLF